MNDKDNPFGTGGDRTIIRPNPGMRRPQPIPPANAPAYQTAPAQPPIQAPYPYTPAIPAAPAPSPYGTPPSAYGSPAPQQGNDAWITSQNQEPIHNAPMQRVEDLRFDELAARNDNPIMRAAGPLLVLLGRMRVAVLRASFASLMEQVASAINFFDKEVRSAGTSAEQATSAKYIICATADDIVQNIPTEDRHVWAQYSMTSRFFGDRVGGIRFFEELDRLLRDPTANYNLLELQHACLALGFQGVHNTSAGGVSQLQQIQRNLYETLRRIRPMTNLGLSPRWQGLDLALKTSRIRLPLWAVAGVAALALFGTFIYLRTIIVSHTEAVAAEISELNSRDKVNLQRRLPAPPPPPVVTPAQLTQLQRIRAALAPEIAAGSVTVDPAGKWIAIRVGNLILFNSGQAAVLPQFNPVADRIAQIVEKEVGPLQIVGHTDNQPLTPLNPFKNNQQLSLERAKSVAALIQPKLSDQSRLVLDGKGPDEPIADNKTSDGRSRNRRVEVLVTRVDGP